MKQAERMSIICQNKRQVVAHHLEKVLKIIEEEALCGCHSYVYTLDDDLPAAWVDHLAKALELHGFTISDKTYAQHYKPHSLWIRWFE